MAVDLTQEQIEDLLIYCGTSPTYWKNEKTNVCCPVHGESNPSMGVNSDMQVCHCFSCGSKGGFAKLLAFSLPEEFGLDEEHPSAAIYKAQQFLAERYELEMRVLSARTKSIKRYGETKTVVKKTNKVLPRYKLAPFKSGKETYKYFFDRGFDKSDMQEYMIGRDLDNKTVTIPVFYENGDLAGIIGRYIDKNRKHNERYKIYDFERGSILYPIDKSSPIDGVAIIVEGQFDCMRMRKSGWTNTYSMMTVEMTVEQAKYLKLHCKEVIDMTDNDKRGAEGRENTRKLLGKDVIYKVVDYPEHGKDVCDWSDEEIEHMIETAHTPLKRRLRRIE